MTSDDARVRNHLATYPIDLTLQHVRLVQTTVGNVDRVVSATDRDDIIVRNRKDRVLACRSSV